MDAISPTAPVTIDPDGWYTDGAARLLLDVTSATLARARRAGELRAARRGLRVWYRGQWLIDWLERGAASDAQAVAHA
jgi:hypothetical protein